MPLTREQKANVRRALRVAKQYGASPREQKALVEAMGVESGYQNLRYGDRDSVGILQQRPSQGWGSANESLPTDVRQFLERARAANTGGGSAGQLAQKVQRSAYPGRYDQRSGEADELIARYGGGSASPGGTTTTTSRVLKTPAVDRSSERRAAVGTFLGQGGVGNSAAVLNLAQTYGQLKDTPAEYGTKTTTRRVRGSTSGGGSEVSALASAVAERADAINAQALPYKWGGGHGGKTKISDPVPLDCSGAVSKVLGIDPRVSGDFQKWGRSGDGGNKGVTIYSNDKHVLMKINGKFFGTSASNPGGGAGWIPRAQVTDEYLAGFTARHSNR